ncbi:DMT family transporter [Acanthopleuribacter pedis]|uniref:Quaternary ammonium compound-resistance protein SugE n=1 Tax=Acanthopleuribacter pedis TaxID=442870 RepID=A0A8J7QJE9_9BACT|nr:SMR family transporter [Acanthopleuribacter pedis]MBO1321941.1 hypothetical protein [Acanthopleuribacter pedis]
MSLFLFALSARTIPTQIAYMVWLAVGVGGVTTIQMLFERQPVTPFQIVCLLFIFIGVAGLKSQA